MTRKLTSKLAMTAIAAALAAPAFAQDSGSGYTGWLTRWIPPHTTMTDTINGNDFRDNRDSTISRNDVPLDQTTLHENDAAWTSSSMSEGDAYRSSAAGTPATVDDGGSEVVVTREQSPAVDDLAQKRETLIVEPASADGTPAVKDSDVTARNPGGVESVQDGRQQDVYTGIEGAGGTDAMVAGSSDETVMAQ